MVWFRKQTYTPAPVDRGTAQELGMPTAPQPTLSLHVLAPLTYRSKCKRISFSYFLPAELRQAILSVGTSFEKAPAPQKTQKENEQENNKENIETCKTIMLTK